MNSITRDQNLKQPEIEDKFNTNDNIATYYSTVSCCQFPSALINTWPDKISYKLNEVKFVSSSQYQ